jgi:hypothetical protein
MHAACAPGHRLQAPLAAHSVGPFALGSRPAHKNWQRLAAALQSALEVFRTRTVYSYLVAKADYGAAAVKYRVLTDVLYGHDHVSACQG